MPDITMCKGEGCPIKIGCYRYRADPSEFRQSYFVEPPIKIFPPSDELPDGHVNCVFFEPLTLL